MSLVERVNSFPAFFPDRHQPGLGQQTQMAGDGGPLAGEAFGNLSGGKRAATELENQENLSPRRVRQSAEHGLNIRQGAPPRKAFSTRVWPK